MPSFFSSVASRLQFRELRLAVRTPVGGAVEHEHQALRSHQRLERARLALLVRQAEVGHAGADLRAQLLDIRHRRRSRRRCRLGRHRRRR